MAEPKAREVSDKPENKVSSAFIRSSLDRFIGLFLTALAGSCEVKCALQSSEYHFVALKLMGRRAARTWQLGM